MSDPTEDLIEEYKSTALREMDLALLWRQRLEQADRQFREHIGNAEKATSLWTALLEERVPKLRVVK